MIVWYCEVLCNARAQAAARIDEDTVCGDSDYIGVDKRDELHQIHGGFF